MLDTEEDSPDSSTAEAIGVEVPDAVEDTASALARLAVGAGKKMADGRSYDVCTIDKNVGYSFNGVVYTKVVHDFGIKATVSASLLRSILTHLTDPDIKETDKGVTLRSKGKNFRLAKLPGSAFKPPSEESSSDEIVFEGGWLKKLLSAAPTVAGYNAFPGVWAGPEGYSACELACMGHLQSSGPSVTTIIPRELVSILPSALLRMSFVGDDQQLIKITAPDQSEWCAPPLAGNFPDWKGVLSIPCDRSAKMSSADLSEALRAVTLLARNGWIEIRNRVCTVSTDSMSHGIASDGATTAKASFDLLETETNWIKLSIDLKKLLNIVESLGLVELELYSTTQADRIVLKSLTGMPYTFVLAHRRGVQDKTHAYTND